MTLLMALAVQSLAANGVCQRRRSGKNMVAAASCGKTNPSNGGSQGGSKNISTKMEVKMIANLYFSITSGSLTDTPVLKTGLKKI